ncbi:MULTISPECIES: hypothetical protein [Bacteroidales]|jgi:hypothetical protein|uniref:hypothetical protein n=1 Tax=Bacteroidales TaxID=171549 RepID=UPI0002FF58D9|nr:MULTISPECIES: hypothetical protein [Bacteroidales]MCE2616439.1 hypothetical protein [Phocaeicola oris]
METKLHKAAYPITCQAQQDYRQFIDAELPPMGTDGHRLEGHKFMIEHVADVIDD